MSADGAATGVARRLFIKAKQMTFHLYSRLFPSRWKRFSELAYWKGRRKIEGALAGGHFKYFYTAHFGLDESFYEGKFILDIGCGPRGSLEWASMASRRVGLDPLAKEYLRLGARGQRMEYLEGRAEDIPLGDGECDAVFSFNSLDHVDDINRALGEIKRITRPGGCFLLLVEVNHPPTASEPHTLGPDEVIGRLQPEFACESRRIFAAAGNGIYESIRAGKEMDQEGRQSLPGYLSAKFIRLAS